MSPENKLPRNSFSLVYLTDSQAAPLFTSRLTPLSLRLPCPFSNPSPSLSSWGFRSERWLIGISCMLAHACLCCHPKHCWLQLSTRAQIAPPGICLPHPAAPVLISLDGGSWGEMGSVWHKTPEPSAQGHSLHIHPGLLPHRVTFSFFLTLCLSNHRHRMEAAEQTFCGGLMRSLYSLDDFTIL